MTNILLMYQRKRINHIKFGIEKGIINRNKKTNKNNEKYKETHTL